MKIERKKSGRKPFVQLSIGAIFEHQNHLYLKTENIYADYGDVLHNVVDIQTGYFDWFYNECLVEEYPEATIII